MISFWSPLMKWVFLTGTVVGLGLGIPLGRQSVFVQMGLRALVHGARRLRLGNPLGWLLRQYREAFTESERLAVAFIESAPWITAGATPSQRADLCAVSVATEEAARHLKLEPGWQGALPGASRARHRQA